MLADPAARTDGLPFELDLPVDRCEFGDHQIALHRVRGLRPIRLPFTAAVNMTVDDYVRVTNPQIFGFNA